MAARDDVAHRMPTEISRGCYQTRDVNDFGPSSPLNGSLDSCHTSSLDLENGSSNVLPIECGRGAELCRLSVDSLISMNSLSVDHSARDSPIPSMYDRTIQPVSNRHVGFQVPFHELPSPSRYLQDKVQRAKNFSAPSSPGIPSNYPGLPRNGCYRDLFKQVSKIAPGQQMSEKVVPDDLTVERLVMKVVSLKRDEPTIPVIEPGLPYMDGRAMAYLLKDIAHRDKVDRAMEIFEWLRKQSGEYRQLCDVYVYTTGIKLCGMRQALGHAICLVAEMKHRGIPCNIHTLSALMNTCIKCAQYNVALDVFSKLQEMGCEANVVTYNTLVDLYGKLGRWRDAIGVIDQVWASGLKPEVRTYNTAIIAANVCNQPQEALKVYQRMLRDGFEPIDTTYTALISAHGKNGDLESAIRTYEDMIHRGLKCNIITYGSLIQAAEQGGHWELALWFSDCMDRDKIAPNTMTFNALLSACAQGAESERAEGLFNAMNNRRLKPDAGAFSALILAHVRAGHWRAALQAWDSMHINSVKADPPLYASLMQCLWESGAPLAEAHAAKLYTQGCRSQSVPRCLKQFHAQNGSLQIRLMAPNSCIAILSLHKMLSEIQKSSPAESNPFGSESVELVIECPPPGDANSARLQLHIQEAIETMLTGLGSPFCRTGTAGGSMLVAETPGLVAWLTKEETLKLMAQYVPLFPPDLNSRPVPVHQTYAVEEASLRRTMQHEHRQFCQIEKIQQEMLKQAAIKYGGCRQECVMMAKLVASTCQLSLDTSYAAMVLLDSALLAGIRVEEQSHLLVAACTFLVASPMLADLRDVGSLCHDLGAAVHAPPGAFIAVVGQLQGLSLPQGTQIATPAAALDMYFAYLRAQSGETHKPKGNQQMYAKSQATALKLLSLVMVDPSALHIRPSIMAAAALAVARKLQGRSPIWPSSLQSWTHIPAGNPSEFELAVSKVTENAEALLCARN